MQILAKFIAVVFGSAVLLFFLLAGAGWFIGGAPETGTKMVAEAPSKTAEAPTGNVVAPPAVSAKPQASENLGEQNHLRLAREEAEIKRLEALSKAHAVDPVKPVKLHYRVKVRDGGTLEAGGTVIRLAGIEAREADGRCTDKGGKDWACGAAARVALTKFIRYRAVSCSEPDGTGKDYAARCTVGGVDLSVWMVRQGWAKPKDGADKALADAAHAARTAHLGIWRSAE
jgi:endonuclease YncB( thermonuclease family)